MESPFITPGGGGSAYPAPPAYGAADLSRAERGSDFGGDVFRSAEHHVASTTHSWVSLKALRSGRTITGALYLLFIDPVLTIATALITLFLLVLAIVTLPLCLLGFPVGALCAFFARASSRMYLWAYTLTAPIFSPAQPPNPEEVIASFPFIPAGGRGMLGLILDAGSWRSVVYIVVVKPLLTLLLWVPLAALTFLGVFLLVAPVIQTAFQIQRIGTQREWVVALSYAGAVLAIAVLFVALVLVATVLGLQLLAIHRVLATWPPSGGRGIGGDVAVPAVSHPRLSSTGRCVCVTGSVVGLLCCLIVVGGLASAAVAALCFAQCSNRTEYSNPENGTWTWDVDAAGVLSGQLGADVDALSSAITVGVGAGLPAGVARISLAAAVAGSMDDFLDVFALRTPTGGEGVLAVTMGDSFYTNVKGWFKQFALCPRVTVRIELPPAGPLPVTLLLKTNLGDVNFEPAVNTTGLNLKAVSVQIDTGSVSGEGATLHAGSVQMEVGVNGGVTLGNVVLEASSEPVSFLRSATFGAVQVGSLRIVGPVAAKCTVHAATGAATVTGAVDLTECTHVGQPPATVVVESTITGAASVGDVVGLTGDVAAEAALGWTANMVLSGDRPWRNVTDAYNTTNIKRVHVSDEGTAGFSHSLLVSSRFGDASILNL